MNKKLFSLFVIIIIALSLSCVSASDSSIISDNSSDIVGVSNDEPIIYDSGNAGDEAVGNVSNNVGTYTDLNNEINNAGSTLILDKDYKYNSTSDSGLATSGIVISKDITIDGAGHTIDGSGNSVFGNSVSRLFVLNTGSFTLKNLNIVNVTFWTGISSFPLDVGVIRLNGGTLSLDNLTFQKCSVNTMISAPGQGNLNMVNCAFLDNEVANLIGITQVNMKMDNNIFLNNSIELGCLINDEASTFSSISNNVFLNNKNKINVYYVINCNNNYWGSNSASKSNVGTFDECNSFSAAKLTITGDDSISEVANYQFSFGNTNLPTFTLPVSITNEYATVNTTVTIKNGVGTVTVTPKATGNATLTVGPGLIKDSNTKAISINYSKIQSSMVVAAENIKYGNDAVITATLTPTTATGNVTFTINGKTENANIVDVIESYGIKLEKKGKDNYVCLCPFHDDHNPNMIVSQAKQIFTCFGGCGATGNVFTFVQKYENVSFIEAVKIVAEKSHQNFNYDINSSKVNDKFSKEYEVMDLSLKFFQNNLASSEGIKAKEYLFKRGITEQIINEFKLGLSINNNSLKKFFESKNVDLELAYKIGLLNKGGTEYYDVFNDRIMIPIFNQSGKLCGYTGRCYLKDEENKYVNSKENEIYKKSEVLFNYFNAKNEINKLKEIVIVEGNMDAITMSTYGIKNVCALMGVVLTSYQIDFLKKQRLKLILMLDNDNAGKTATLKVGDNLYNAGIDVRVVRLSGAKDPDEYVRKNGIDALKDNISNARKFIDFKIEALKDNYDLSSVEDIQKYVKSVLDSIKSLSDIEKSIIINRLSETYHIDVNILKKDITFNEKPKMQEPVIKQKKKSGYDLAVSNIIYGMLQNKEYYFIFANRLGYLKNRVERMTVAYIKEYIDKYKQIDIAGFLDYVVKYEDVYAFVSDVLSNNDKEISEKWFLEALDRANNEIDKMDLKQKKYNAQNEMDANMKINDAQKWLEKRRKIEYEERM